MSVEAARYYVAGYCCANDLSARRAQLATIQWMIGKMLDGFLPLDPYLVTADEIPDPLALLIKSKPGDVIITGTPKGAQMGFKSPTWLKSGDRVSFESSGLGSLTNTLING